MGTKNNPGAFDCYANAEPDEPMFVLLGRDKHASILVDLWAELRAMEGETTAKVNEALDCAESMRAYRAKRKAAFVFSRSECPFQYCDTKAPHHECRAHCRHRPPSPAT